MQYTVLKKYSQYLTLKKIYPKELSLSLADKDTFGGSFQD